MNRKAILGAWAICLVGSAFAFATPYEHVGVDKVSLNGTWEMAYRPYAHETVDYPAFTGHAVDGAVPGYWEDMREKFRAAGFTDDFRINPWYERQTFPIHGSARDLTFPNIYGCFYYRRTVRLEKTGEAVLYFEGVRNQVHVWVNGRFIGFRAGFSTPFEMSLPKDVLKTGPNEIVLAVSNNPNLGYGDYVSGLTTRAVFRATGGVNGNLELRFLKHDLGDVYVTTAADLKHFTIHVTGTAAYAYAVEREGKTFAKGEARGDVTLSTAGYAFWSPENPVRYTLRIRAAGAQYVQAFGLRRLTAQGPKILLNGRCVYLRGVTEHCYFPKTIHLPRDLDYYRMITDTRKRLGFNFVRFHTFVPPAEYLEATDERGMLVHIESPNFVSESEYAAIVAFARRHPSVVIYCTGNETRIDRLAEAYLRDVAGIVHAQTDALFSPMSALRGVEYAFYTGKDPLVSTPFRHNAERLGRLLEYCDLFTSYQLGATSYDSLNGASARTVDARCAAYGAKPVLSHETCIDGSYVDLNTEKGYPPDSPVLKAGIFSGIRAQLSARGLLDRAPVYYRHSCEWMRRIRKHAFEKVRASRLTSGYDFLGDINTHWHTFGYSVGMMDEFYRLKPGETVENVRRYNSAAVLLADLGSDFVFTAGTARKVSFTLSNYADDLRAGVLRVTLEDTEGKVVAEKRLAPADVPLGTVAEVGAWEMTLPAAATPRKYLLRAALSSAAVTAENVWEIYAFPAVDDPVPPANVRVVRDIAERDLLSALAKGERVVLLGAGPFNALPSTFRIGMAGRCSGDFATIVKTDHPVFAAWPNEGYLDWAFRRLVEGGRTVQLEAGVPFDPIVDVASAVKCVIRQAALFEYRVGTGRLLVSSFNFQKDDPAARYLKARLFAYAASNAFQPPLTLTPEALSAVIHAPKLSGALNDNRARNPNDPSSDVRADALAQP